MKKTLQALALIVLGIVLGTLATTRISAQRNAFPTPIPVAERRLIYYTAVFTDQDGWLRESAGFIRDTKTGGCWLRIRVEGQQLIASAPSESCQQ